MTIPTPAALAARPLAVKEVRDTRCGAEHTNGITVYTCCRHGAHDRHVDAAHNVAWKA